MNDKRFIEHIIEPKALNLVWQSPLDEGRKRLVVAKLCKVEDNQEKAGLDLEYLTNTKDFVEAQKLGFKGYSAFTLRGREGEELHRYKDLMQSFLSRLPPRKREDFNEYLEGFRIKSDSKLSDFALLGYTAARLPSDSFSILHTFEDAVGPFEFLLEVVGFQSSNVDSGETRVGQKAEFQKAYDSKHAGELEIMISVSGQQLGYVARGLVPSFSQWMDQGRIQAAFIEKKNGTQDRPVLFLYVEIKA